MIQLIVQHSIPLTQRKQKKTMHFLNKTTNHAITNALFSRCFFISLLFIMYVYFEQMDHGMRLLKLSVIFT